MAVSTSMGLSLGQHYLECIGTWGDQHVVPVGLHLLLPTCLCLLWL